MYKTFEVFTDGSCFNNPGPGGYGIIMRSTNYEKVFSCGYHYTTNNRMELLAVITAIELLKIKSHIIFNIDSLYVKKGVTDWIANWKKRNWRTINKKPVKNIDLWKRVDLGINFHNIYWKWIRSHTGHIENERCDQLAKKAASYPTKTDLICS